MFGSHTTSLQEQLAGAATSKSPNAPRCHLRRVVESPEPAPPPPSGSKTGLMEGLRKVGEKLEEAVGLPHHVHHTTAPGAPAAGPPEWATSEHYPGQGAVKVVAYPDDTPLPPPKVEEHPRHKVDLSHMSPRAQAIVKEVGHELEESPHIIG